MSQKRNPLSLDQQGVPLTRRKSTAELSGAAGLRCRAHENRPSTALAGQALGGSRDFTGLSPPGRGNNSIQTEEGHPPRTCRLHQPMASVPTEAPVPHFCSLVPRDGANGSQNKGEPLGWKEASGLG